MKMTWCHFFLAVVADDDFTNEHVGVEFWVLNVRREWI